MTYEEFQEIVCPPHDQRMMIVGASGTGKTTLAREILRPYDAVLVIDPKCTYGGKDGEEGYTLVRTPRQLRSLNKGHTHIQYRPSEDHQSIPSYNEVYEWAFRQGQKGHSRMVYTDEVYLIMSGSTSPKWLTACITCGRELGVGMINGSQRPVGVDRRIYTESETIVAFRLRHEDDQKLISKVMGTYGQPEGHSFWIRRDGWKQPRLLTLQLPGDTTKAAPEE